MSVTPPPDAPPTEADIAALAAFDTPTICNALELVLPERRAVGYTVRPLVSPLAAAKSVVAYARTATIRTREPSGHSAAENAAQMMRWYEYVADGPRPCLAVIQDLDGAFVGYGAFWGEVQTNVHLGLGCVGAITDGCVRDVDLMAPGFFVLAGSVAPSHAWAHVEEIGGTVNVAGMTVKSGDLVHADRHGAVVVPRAAVRRLPEAVALIGRREAVIVDAARLPGFDIAALKRAIGTADDIH